MALFHPLPIGRFSAKDALMIAEIYEKFESAITILPREIGCQLRQPNYAFKGHP